MRSVNLSDAVHVLDRFHVMKLFNEKLSNLRRDLHRQAQTKEHKQVIKGTRWLLLKNAENLDEQRRERERLDAALRLNQPLSTAYYLKEDLRQFWAQTSRRTAERFLDDWLARAEASGVAMLRKFANTLRLHRAGLLNWYDHPISPTLKHVRGSRPASSTLSCSMTFRRPADCPSGCTGSSTSASITIPG